ncbi:protein of unknown function [Candidatus Hydrogenisulfobacillus filiaventi]|uniref:Uncharacterized protein n=1 Tax=Candidatus Hydrogenisulfobacillus filiaventi TaxID=2707344 RepID=A0A6F8ZIJ8_9FIRM|nr:protein of unknown function [Candidatus Hydrogenisulfobacillus filiaventi]
MWRVGSDPWHPDQTELVGYCSDACKEEAWDGEFPPEVCDRCGRWFWAYVGDRHNASASNFLADEAGQRICLRCAGVRREDLTWERLRTPIPAQDP